jgi:hypothetical protein
MLPADECLSTDYRVIFETDFRLIEELELIPLQCLGQFCL